MHQIHLFSCRSLNIPWKALLLASLLINIWCLLMYVSFLSPSMYTVYYFCFMYRFTYSTFYQAVQMKVFIDNLRRTNMLQDVDYTFWNECFTSKVDLQNCYSQNIRIFEYFRRDCNLFLVGNYYYREIIQYFTVWQYLKRTYFIPYSL